MPGARQGRRAVVFDCSLLTRCYRYREHERADNPARVLLFVVPGPEPGQTSMVAFDSDAAIVTRHAALGMSPYRLADGDEVHMTHLVGRDAEPLCMNLVSAGLVVMLIEPNALTPPL
jgi:hypothetical protein